jgi:hypothetical protein
MGSWSCVNPLEGLDAIQPTSGLACVVVTLVGSTAYDGLSHTSWWIWHVPPGTVAATLELGRHDSAGRPIIYLLGTWILVGSDQRPSGSHSPSTFAHSIVPIAACYAVAHYFSALFFEGQQALILSSDPFGRGWNLFGTANQTIDYTIIAIRTIALVQIGAIVMEHLLAAVSAHERAVQLFPPRMARSVQYPLLVAMVGLTTGAVGLVFAS